MGTPDLLPQEIPPQHRRAHVLPPQTETVGGAVNEAVQPDWQRTFSKRGRKTSSTRHIRPNQIQSTFSVGRGDCPMAKKAKCNRSEAPEVRMGVVGVALASHLEAAKLPRRPLLCRRRESWCGLPWWLYCTVTVGHVENSRVVMLGTLLQL